MACLASDLQLIVGETYFSHPYTMHHSSRVALLAQGIAQLVSPYLAQSAFRSGLYHDIAKNDWPAYLINKACPLDEDEITIVRLHPIVGAYKLIDSGISEREVLDGVRYHHERWDGTGYPHALSGTQIPLIGRIIKVADAIDAIRSDRPYSAAQPDDVVIEELIKGSGSIFDPYIAYSAIRLLEVPP